MATVYIPAQLRQLCDGRTTLEIEGNTLRDIIAGVEGQFVGLAGRLRSGDAIATGFAVSIDGAITSKGLLARVAPQSEIHFLPAIGGG